ncbi:uncharacterized protein [Dysidea avara]|uniref:uncharacterized protein n=1 Tax=Dysidea avara TaxID=196820 RepID=UPI00332070BC
MVPSTSTTNQQKEEKEEQLPTAVASKKQSSTKHTSRLLEQQLNTMEELLMQGQKKMNAVEKEIAEFTNTTDETLSHKYREQYNCLCEAVDVIMILLGREGSEKLMMTLSNAAPNNIFGDKKLVIPINNLADVIKSAVSRVMLELKLFIKLKWMHQRKLAAIPNKRTLLTSEDAKKSINELQKWLDKELKGIDEEIIGSVQHYEEHKKEIETTQVAYFDQLSKKIDGTIQKLYKSMEKLEVPDEIESMLGNILATVEQLNDNPAPKHKPHTSSMESTEEEIVATNVVGGNANWLSTLSIPAIDAIRKNVAGHLRTKVHHGVNISTTSWRTKAYKKKERPQPSHQENTPSRKFLMPSLANRVDFSANSSFNFSNQPPSKSPSEAVHLPTIHKQQPRRFSEVLQQTMYPYATRHTPATTNATRIFARKMSQKQQKVTHALPHVENTTKLTGPKTERLRH